MNTARLWTYTVTMDSAVHTQPGLFSLSENGRWVISSSLQNNLLTVLIRTYAKDAPLKLTADLSGYPAGTENQTVIELIWLGYRLELWINGRMAEEEWTMGDSFKEENPRIVCADCILSSQWVPTAQVREFVPRAIEDILFWAPDLGNENVGDCMPFSDGDTYHLFYLKDRHGHQSKWGKGAHQFAHISTNDLVHWEEHPMAVEITHPWEGSICTGSILKANDKYYAFYAARMMDETSARLSWAVSDDGIHFTKSEKYFTLNAPYETTSARDPEVFLGADGLYHMLVTTNLADWEIPKRSGCLAHLTSADLETWEQQEPFIVPGYTDQPECCNYFEWNGWYYLIFSNYGLAKYRYSRQPFGPWIRPENETIGGPFYRVPKTAGFHGRRIAAGFVASAVGGESYAGSVVFRELLQNEDGTLAFCQVKELQPPTAESALVTVSTTPVYAYRQEKLAENSWFLHCDITPDCPACGLLLNTGCGTYEIRLDSSLRRISVVPAHTAIYNRPEINTLDNVSGLDKPCTLDIFWKNGVLDLCFNRERTLCCRLEAFSRTAEDKNQWFCYAKDGQASFCVHTTV